MNYKKNSFLDALLNASVFVKFKENKK